MNTTYGQSRSRSEGSGVSRDGSVVSDSGRRWAVAVLLMLSWVAPAAARGVLSAVQMTEGTRVIVQFLAVGGYVLLTAVALLFAANPRRLPVCFWASILNMIFGIVGVIIGVLADAIY